jgi:hypothetical protein
MDPFIESLPQDTRDKISDLLYRINMPPKLGSGHRPHFRTVASPLPFKSSRNVGGIAIASSADLATTPRPGPGCVGAPYFTPRETSPPIPVLGDGTTTGGETRSREREELSHPCVQIRVGLEL